MEKKKSSSTRGDAKEREREEELRLQIGESHEGANEDDTEVAVL